MTQPNPKPDQLVARLLMTVEDFEAWANEHPDEARKVVLVVKDGDIYRNVDLADQRQREAEAYERGKADSSVEVVQVEGDIVFNRKPYPKSKDN